MLAIDWLRSVSFVPALIGLVLVVSCAPAGICDGFDSMARTEHFVIPEWHAAEIAVAADAGYGRTCQRECGWRDAGGRQPVRSCSVGGPADGGVALTCTFANVCR